MKVIDCITYFNEDVVLDVRLNTLDKFVDYFVIVECAYEHQGKKKIQNFDINKFKKFEKKIIYKFIDELPKNFLEYQKKNHWWIENYQRNYISNLLKFDKNDFIIISDLDEIPNLENINLEILLKKYEYIFFAQDLFYYKFNNQNLTFKKWPGSRGCQLKNLVSPQHLRNTKFPRKYEFFKRYFSKNYVVDDGGWHFSFIFKTNEIIKKIKSFAHKEWNNSFFTDKKKVEERINNNLDLFDRGYVYKKYDQNKLPKYIIENKEKFKEYLIS